MAADSSDVSSFEEAMNPRYVASRFVQQYYLVLERSPEDVHKFYNDQSVITRKGPDGEMVSITTTEEINNEIMSSNYKGCSFGAINIDAQESMMEGVLVTLMGNVIGMENVSRRFNQTFFLARQPTGYFVLNDILRFSDPLQETLPTSTDTGVNVDNDPSVCEIPATLQHEPENETTDENETKGDNFSVVYEKESDIKSIDVFPSDTKTEKSILITIGETVLSIDCEENSPIENGKKEESDTKDKVVENEVKDKSALTDMASNEQQESKRNSYASVVANEAKVTSTNISSNKIVRVAPNGNQQSNSTASATPNNNLKKENIASNSATDNNNCHTDVVASKSIYIANLPQNVTKSVLADALKPFGRIRQGGIQIRVFEDGFCYGFVDFESASSASKAVEVHYVTVGGNEAYMMYKKSGRSRNGSGGGFNGRSRNNPKGHDIIQESHGSNDDNHAVDIKNQQNEETNWQTYSKGARVHSRNRQHSNERPRTAGEAQMKNGYEREVRSNRQL